MIFISKCILISAQAPTFSNTYMSKKMWDIMLAQTKQPRSTPSQRSCKLDDCLLGTIGDYSLTLRVVAVDPNFSFFLAVQDGIRVFAGSYFIRDG